MIRYAIRKSDKAATEVRTMAAYMPSNYEVTLVNPPSGPAVLIMGEDRAGWTLDGYVLPRLASGMYSAREITRNEALVLEPYADL